MQKPEIISKSYAENLTAEALNKLFEMVCSTYNDKSIFENVYCTQKNIYANESGFSTNPNQKKMFLKKIF